VLLQTRNIFHIQGTEVLLEGDPVLKARVSDYLRQLYQGDSPRPGKPLRFRVHPPKGTVRLPSGAVKEIQGPHACCYRCGEEILFASNNGTSIIRLDPVRGEIEGLLDKEFSKDSSKFFSLLGFTITETLKYCGLYFLHGSCVYGDGKAYLFSGSSGSGKTTAAFNLVRQGFQYVADDSLLMSKQDEEIVVSPYYTNFHVDEKVVKRCPEMSGARLKDPERGITRMRVIMTEIYPDSFAPSLRPDRIIFPRIEMTGTSYFSPLNQIETCGRLLKQTILAVDIAIAREQLRVIEGLAKQVKAFELITGQDMYNDPKTLPALLKKMEGENGNTQEVWR
jgi:hypothetical protein